MAKVKKELEVVMDVEGYYKAQFKGGGQLPEELSGIFTKRTLAQAAIDSYLKKRDGEEVKETPKPKAKPKVKPKEKVEKDAEDTTTES